MQVFMVSCLSLFPFLIVKCRNTQFLPNHYRIVIQTPPTPPKLPQIPLLQQCHLQYLRSCWIYCSVVMHSHSKYPEAMQ